MGNLFNFLAAPPGNLVYHLVLAFAITTSLQTVLIQKPRLADIATRRVLISLGLLLIGQLALFFFSLLGWLDIYNPRYLLPPLDRLVTVLSLLCILWIWLFYDQPQRLTDGGVLILALVALFFFIFTMVSWSRIALTYTFNFTPLEISWSLLGILSATGGGILLVLKRPREWGFGLGIAALYFFGFLIHFIWGSPDLDYPGAVRVAQVCAFPLLPLLARRLQTTPPISPKNSSGLQQRNANIERYSAEARTIYTWLNATLPNEPARVYTTIARAIAQTMMADMCYLVPTPSTDRKVNISYGYDLTSNKELMPFSIDEAKIPTLAEALKNGQPLEMDVKNPDLMYLLEIMGVDVDGLLLVPLNSSQEIWGGALLLNPNSKRPWDEKDQNYLSLISDIVVKILQNPNDLATRTTQGYPGAALPIENRAEPERMTEETAPANETQELLAVQKELQSANDRLKEDIEKLHAQIDISVTPAMDIEVREMVENFGHHLHPSLASMQGHSEMLLSQTIGVLSSHQRQSLEHIRNLVLNIRKVIDNISNGQSISKESDFKFQISDMNAIIDDVVADTSAQMRQKTINLRIDLPEEIPTPQIDQDILKQILVQLLENAASITPAKGSIGIRAREEKVAGVHNLVIQVIDSGGGIDARNQKLLFIPQPPGKPLKIPGVGSKNNLCLARTLVEAYGGKIQVESARGQPTTISISLTIDDPDPGQQEE